MDEKQRKLRVLERTEIAQDVIEETIAPKVEHQKIIKGQTNPILKNLAKFANEKIGGGKCNKWSIKDLLR